MFAQISTVDNLLIIGFCVVVLIFVCRRLKRDGIL